MALPLPGSLTPSKVSTFKECALAFRLSVIERLPEPASLQAFKGTVVHRALQLLMWDEPPGRREPEAALAKLDQALDELLVGPEGLALALQGEELQDFVADAQQLVRNYFSLEDPNRVRVIGTELQLQVDVQALARPPGGWLEPPESAERDEGTVHTEAAERAEATVPAGARPEPPSPEAGMALAPEGQSKEAQRVRLRGIIDRLELDDDGELVVTDYKTGRAPGPSQEQNRLGGVHFYAFLCEQVLGRRPARVQLFHLREPVAISTAPSEQSISGLERQAMAIWTAVKRACVLEDFRPKPGPACEWCGYHEYCPSMGGDLSLLRAFPEDAGSRTAGNRSSGPTSGLLSPPSDPQLPLPPLVNA